MVIRKKNINEKTITNTIENCTMLQNDFAHFYSIESSALFSSDKVNEQRLRWSRGSLLALGTQVRGFKPGRSRRIFRAKKSSARLPSERK
jgi:hypothetical protein